MANEQQTVTREELYELVWSTSMVKLAERFGCSDVALAKLCKRMDVPRPGRGHWARLAAGQSSRRQPLPKAKRGTLLEATTPEGYATGEPGGPKTNPPETTVPERLTTPHPVIVDLRKAVAGVPIDQTGRRRLRSRYDDNCYLVSPTAEPRAMRLLHAVLVTLEERGATHEFRCSGAGDHLSGQILCQIGTEEPIELEISEELDRQPHKLTREEQRQQDRYGRYYGAQYDYSISGRLRIRIGGYRVKLARRSWGDSKTQVLDRLLGEVVLAVEEAAHRIREARIAKEREEAERKEQRRATLRGELHRWHGQALVNDLVEMSDRWSTARVLREFVAVAGESVPTEQQSEEFAAWLAWASRYANAIQ